MAMSARAVLSCVAFALLGGVHAQVSDHDRDVLIDFYHATGGDDWHHNDGWLDPAVDVCDWFGVDCQFRHEVGRDVLVHVELPANNLSGELDTRIFEIVHSALDLSDNRIGGTLEKLPQSPGRVDLSNNALSGTLPNEFARRAGDLSGSGPPSGTWFLDLSGNDFEGEVPADWTGTIWLSLASNRLEGLPVSLFERARFLDISGNRFSGKLPEWIVEHQFLPHNGASRWGGGLNLCWNDFEIDDPELIGWIGERHVGGANFEQCLSRERLETDPALSGSWFDPARSGEGISMHLLDNDQALLYWFTFDEQGNPMWLFEVGKVQDRALQWKSLMRTRGHFGQGFANDDEDPPTEIRGSFRLDRTGEDRQMAERIYIDSFANACILPYPPPLSCFGNSLSDRLDYQRLTELAGTTCDKQSDAQQHSGAWYNPDLNGEGFIVEVLPDDHAVIYWFTYQPDGSGEQAWMIADGEIETNIIIVPSLPGPRPTALLQDVPTYQPLGGIFGPDFDPDEVEMTDWGTLSITFYEDDTAKVEWESVHPEYGSGDYRLERLSQPLLAECE